MRLLRLVIKWPMHLLRRSLQCVPTLMHRLCTK
uniref:Fk506 binding protein n=1 Tax=Rhizophora mucronata TaxID=61149 RepID=A0A2P2MVF8_RHIMU